MNQGRWWRLVPNKYNRLLVSRANLISVIKLDLIPIINNSDLSIPSSR